MGNNRNTAHVMPCATVCVTLRRRERLIQELRDNVYGLVGAFRTDYEAQARHYQNTLSQLQGSMPSGSHQPQPLFLDGSQGEGLWTEISL